MVEDASSTTATTATTARNSPLPHWLSPRRDNTTNNREPNMNNNTPRTRPASEDVTKNSNQQESPVSVMGLYPVVHDLSEIEYRECCNPFDALSDWFHEDSTSCSSHHYLVEEVATTTPTIPTTPASAPTPSRPKMFELDASSRDLLLTPNLDHDEQGSARDDSFRELPDFLPKPAALEHRRRATSCEVVQSVVAPNQDSSVSSTREEEEEADDDVVPLPPTSFHRRSMSEGAGVVFHQAFQVNSSRNEVGGTPNSGSSSMTFHEKRFRDEYVPIRRIFECNDSTVWDCIHRKTGEHYCVKKVENNEKSAKEIKRLKQAQSAHTVKLVEVIQEVDKIYIVMELMSGGNLLSRVIQKGPMPEATVRRMAYRLIRGVLHMHRTLYLCHNDLQPSNILLDDDKKRINIADFGAATRSSNVPSFNSACQPPYRAPERLTSPAADMWSVGVILYFCLYGQHASMEQGCEALSDYLHHRGGDTAATNIASEEENKPALSRYAKQFLCNLIHLDPDVRLTAQEALRHPWLSGISERKNRPRSADPEKPLTTPEGPRNHHHRRMRKRVVAEKFQRLLTYVKGGDKSVMSMHST